MLLLRLQRSCSLDLSDVQATTVLLSHHHADATISLFTNQISPPALLLSDRPFEFFYEYRQHRLLRVPLDVAVELQPQRRELTRDRQTL